MQPWQLQTAKNRLSEVVRAAATEPQVITIHGREVAVVLSVEAFQRLSRPQGTLVAFLQGSPLGEAL
jgi:prevent-host-death family protein